MSETVNDTHGNSRKNRKCSTPLKKPKTKSSGKSPPDTLKPEFSRRVTQKFESRRSGLEVDNSSFTGTREHENFKAKTEPADGEGVDAAKDDVPASEMARDEPQDIKLPRIESTYFDLIKAGRRDQITLEPEDVEVDHDLIAELAKSLSSRDQPPPADIDTDPVPGRIQNQRVDINSLQNSHNSGLWTRPVRFGSAVMLAAGVMAVLLVKTQELPEGVVENTRVALATNLIGLKPDAVVTEKTPAALSLPAENKNTEAASVTRFVPPPVLVEVLEAKALPDGVSNNQADEERTIKVENLNKNLKIMRAYLSSQQLAYSDASFDEKPKLLQEVTKIKTELTSLEEKIIALQPPAIIAPSTEIAGITPAPGEIEKAALGAISEGESDGNDITVAPPAVSSKPRKTRNRAKVELALASMPGLYRLQPVSRSRLKSKLISGECLVPALSSVFPQVPALVMRDMVRQFEGQC